MPLFLGEERVVLLPGLYEGGALAQPFQFLGTGVGAGTAYSTEQVENRVFSILPR